MANGLRGIFRKRRQLLTHLFHTATETLRDAFRTRLHLPDGRIGAIGAVHTFGDYLIFHPHLHVLAANGLFTPDGHFHCMPAEDRDPAIELSRHRFLHALREAKLISPGKLADLLSWKHSGFHIHDGGEKPVAAHDSAGRKRLAEYLLRHPFSLQKITWNASTQTVIYRSKRHHNTKRNFEIFEAPDFIAAALLHLPPKGQQTVRYYGTYSNKTRGQTPLIPDRIIRPPVSSNQQSKINNYQSEILLIPAPPKQSARDMRPLWRDLILQVWGGDPLQCTCCKGTMKPVRKVNRREEIEYSLLTSVSISCIPKADWYGVRDSVLNFFSASKASGRESSHSRARRRHPSTSRPWSRSNRPGRRSRNGFPTTNPTSTGSTVPGIQISLTQTGSTRRRHGKHLKSIWTTAAS